MKSFLAGRYGGFLVVVATIAVIGALFRDQSLEAMSPGVLAWWIALCAVSLFNICMWRLSAARLERDSATALPAIFRFQRRQLVLAAVFVLGCAFRSLLPRADVQRLGLVDSWFSSVLVGRSVATLAELCFAAQWALVLNVISRDAQFRPGVVISWLLLPLIAIAECCSWHSVLTTAYLGNALEESIWTVCAGLVVGSFALLWNRGRRPLRPFLAASILLGCCYIAFMCTVDIPMYVSRWRADEAVGREYLSLYHGVWDAGSRWIVSHSWDEWRPEMPWMTLYFSVCVWCSLFLAHLPRTAQLFDADISGSKA